MDLRYKCRTEVTLTYLPKDQLNEDRQREENQYALILIQGGGAKVKLALPGKTKISFGHAEFEMFMVYSSRAVNQVVVQRKQNSYAYDSVHGNINF